MPVHTQKNNCVNFAVPEINGTVKQNCICVHAYAYVCAFQLDNAPHIVVYAPETQNSLVSIQIHLYLSIRLPSTLSRQHKAWNDLIYNTISLATDFAFDTH